MTLTRNQKVLTGIALAIVLVGVLAFLSRDAWMPLPETSTFKNRQFSFVYPRLSEAEEYASGVVSIGSGEAAAFVPLVEVVRYKHDRDVAIPSTFTVFMQRQAQALCGSDNSVESITCTEVKAVPYTSPQGLVGHELALTLMRKNLKTGTTTSSSFAPIYVFNTTREVESADKPLRFEAIFVYPSLSSFLVGSTSTALLNQIADTLVIEGGVSTIGEL